MNAPFRPDAVRVDAIDLGDAAAVAAVEAWIAAHPDSTPFHRPAWVKAIAKGCRQRPHYLVARHGDGAIAGLLPLTEVRSALFGRALVSSGFAVDGGILADGDSAVDALGLACRSLAGRLKCPTAELRGGRFPAGWTVRDGAYLGFSRPLAADGEAELLAIPRKHRAELRKGLANDLTVETGRCDRLRAAHYRCYAEMVHNLGTPVFPRALFDAVLDIFGEDADILLISKDTEPVSAVLTLYHKGVCMPYWGGGRWAARALRANEVMYFRLMDHARARGCTRFDFGRSKVGTGAAAWKKSWGFEGQPLAYAVRSAAGRQARDVNPLSPRYRRKVELWKKLPLPVANLIGPFLARGLG